MKKYLFILAVTFLLPAISRAQEPDALLKQTARQLFEQREYHRVIIAAELYGREYGNDPLMQMLKLYSWLELSDMEHFRAELAEAVRSNPLIERETYLRMYIDRKYMAELLASDYSGDTVLDPARDYKPLLTACDTVRGALRPARNWDVRFYDLQVEVFPEEQRIEGKNRIVFTAVEPAKMIQIDLFDNYDVLSLTLNGKELEFVRVCNAIFAQLEEELQPLTHYVLEIGYAGIPRIAPNPPWDGGFVWEKSKNRHWIGVACEHLGASSWWPCKDHLSDKPDSMRVTVTVPGGYQAVSNGNLRSVTNHKEKTTSFEWFIGYPINTYNVTLYVGDFVNFSEVYRDDDEEYRVDYYVLKKNLKKAREYYSQTAEILRVFGDLFGPYPFPGDGAGFVEAPFAGMEHQGAIAIGDEYGENFRFYYNDDEHDYLLVHETAHEWWGNAVAVGDMADAWINEGFATYAEYLFLEKLYGYPAYLNAFGANSRMIFNAWPLVGDRDVNDDTFISGDIYNKGAAMLNNLRCIIADDSIFFSIVKGFYERSRMGISSTDDFKAYVAGHYPGDLTAFFDVFLHRAEPPVLEYSFALAGGSLVFDYRWTGVGKDFHMPFALMVNDTSCVRLDGTTELQQFVRRNTGTFYIVTPNRYDETLLLPNSFTYFQTWWERN